MPYIYIVSITLSPNRYVYQELLRMRMRTCECVYINTVYIVKAIIYLYYAYYIHIDIHVLAISLVHYTLYTIYIVQYIYIYIVYNVPCIMYIVHYTLYTVYWTYANNSLYTANCIYKWVSYGHCPLSLYTLYVYAYCI